MSTNALIIAVVILLVIYFVYRKSVEKFLERQMNGNLQVDIASDRTLKSTAVIGNENFLERQMNGNLQTDLASSRTRPKMDYEMFDNYHGDPTIMDESINGNRLDENGAGIYAEFMRTSVDPSLQSRQTNFIKDMNDGDLSKSSYSAVNTAKYVTREAESPANVIGIRPVRSVTINYNQKQVPEIMPEDSYADEDPRIDAVILGRNYKY